MMTMKTNLLVVSAIFTFAVPHLGAQQATMQGSSHVGSLKTQTPVTMELTDSTVTVRGLTPHGTAVIFAMLRLPHKYWTSSARREFVVTDDDGDGIVQVTSLTVPPGSVWFAAEI